MIPVPKPAPRPATPKKPPRKVNRKRAEKRFEENFGGEEYLALIRSLPCAICGERGSTIAAHLTARGAGGKAEDIAPMCCNRIEIYTDRGGRTFWRVDQVFPRRHVWTQGCHERYDARDPQVRKHEPRLKREAAARWLSYLNPSKT